MQPERAEQERRWTRRFQTEVEIERTREGGRNKPEVRKEVREYKVVFARLQGFVFAGNVRSACAYREETRREHGASRARHATCTRGNRRAAEASASVGGLRESGRVGRGA
eukprot:5792561-Pleurochrysis_carterae.AAC.1